MDDSDLYRLFKTLHTLAVMLLAGGFVLEGLIGPLVARGRSVQEVRVYARLMYISENYLSLPAALFTIIFGYAAADRLGIPLDTTWLLLGQVLFYAIVVLALAILRPAANRLHHAALAAPDGPLTPELVTMLKNPLLPIVGTLTTVMFVFIVYLMVVKPAW